MATTNASAASWGTRLVNRWRRKEYERKLKNRQTDGPLIKLTPQQKGMNVLLHLIMLLMLLYCVIPLIWLVFSSTKTNEGLYASFGLWFDDENVFFQNIVDTFTFQEGVYTRWLLNSILYAVVAGLGSTILAAFAGYAIATMRFPGRNMLLWITLISCRFHPRSSPFRCF